MGKYQQKAVNGLIIHNHVILGGSDGKIHGSMGYQLINGKKGHQNSPLKRESMG